MTYARFRGWRFASGWLMEHDDRNVDRVQMVEQQG
jgi:hypothetical protein